MTSPRIQLIHAVPTARDPIQAAFGRLWPDAEIAEFTDDSLASDLEQAGELTDAFTSRMAGLIGRGIEADADAVLFTCSAFGAAIEQARADVDIPVLKPDEAMIERALSLGSRIGGLATFAPTIGSLSLELAAAADALGLTPQITLRHVPGAIEALNDGRDDEHNSLIANAAADMTDVDVLMLAQYSMVRARDAIADVPGRTVLAAPDEAVEKLRGLLGN
jgi:hypothetical protein